MTPSKSDAKTEGQREEANKNVVRTYSKRMFNDHSPDSAAELLAPGAKWHGGNLGSVEGAQNIVGLFQGVLAALPDLKNTEQEIIAEGDTVVIRSVIEATHKGNLLGFPATNRRVRWDAIDMYRISNGKIVEEWASEDSLKILADIGVYTPPWMKGAP
jgi:predicted ester cyclase